MVAYNFHMHIFRCEILHLFWPLTTDCLYCQGVPLTTGMLTHTQLLTLKGTVYCEVPNRHLYNFVGTLALTKERYLPSCLPCASTQQVTVWQQS